jgi:hypothetical protein
MIYGILQFDSDGKPINRRTYPLSTKGQPILAYILSHKIVHGESDAYLKRLDLILEIPTEFLISELAAINYESKPPQKLTYSIAPAFQKKWTLQFLRRKTDQKMLFDAWERSKQKVGESGRVIVFHRAATLFAINELILDAPCDRTPHGFQPTDSDWLNMFNYYLCVNELINSKTPTENHRAVGFENLAAQSIFLNELAINEDPHLKLNRFVPLYRHIYAHATYGQHLKEYISDLGFEHAGKYLETFATLYLKPQNQTGEATGCYYQINRKDHDAINSLQRLSKRHLDRSKSEYDLVEIKRSPFYKLSVEGEHYLLLDNQYLIDKIYDIFINEFYFSFLKPKKGITIKQYKGVIGNHFEKYICNILLQTLAKKHLSYKSLDELKTVVNGNEIELCDVYFRQNKKVLLGEIKVTNLTAKQFEGSPEDFFAKGRETFYDRFGLKQLLTAVQRFCASPILFEEMKVARSYQVYPVLILNERSVQAHIVPHIFRQEFEKRLKEIDAGKHLIQPLTVLHIGDLEVMNENLEKGQIWDLLMKTSKGLTHSIPMSQVLQDDGVVPIYKYNFFEFIRNGS